MSSTASLTGPQRAALVILGLDEAVATQVLRHLDDESLRRLSRTVESFGPMPIDALEPALEAFEAGMAQPMLPSAGGAYVRKLAAAAVGEDRVKRLLTAPAAEPQAMDTIRTARASTLATLLEDEHPQIVAVILSQLPRDRAAAALLAMPVERQNDLFGRIASLRELPPHAVAAASEAVARALAAEGGLDGAAEAREFDGVSFAAGILNEIEPTHSERLLAALAETRAPIAPKVREAMFTFEELIKVGARGIQVLMKEVPADALLIALRTASEALREHFLAAVSSRAAITLREDLAAMAPTRLSEVERAQREIVELAMRLGSEGKIVLPSGSSAEKLV